MKRLAMMFASMAALFSCTSEIGVTDQPLELKGLVATAADFDYSATKTVISQSGAAAPSFAWKEGDVIGVIPMDGETMQSNYKIKAIGTDPKQASFDGGVWALKEGKEYAAYYPFQKEAVMSGENISFSFDAQTQSGNNSLAHVGDYDYMYASTVSPADGSADFEFKHLVSLVRLELTVPAGEYKKVSLESDMDWFATEASLELSTGEMESVKTSKIADLMLEDVALSESSVLTVWLSVLPTSVLNGKTLEVSLLSSTTLIKKSTPSLNSFEAGKAYSYGVVFDESDAPSDKPAANQIFYTSSDGSVIEPKTGSIDAEVVSNVYAEDRGIITFSSDITKIGSQAFYNKTKLVSIELPDGVTTIGSNAFDNDFRLESVVLPANLKAIGGYAFNGCNKLDSVVIPDSVTYIGEYVFFGCSSLTSIVIPDCVTSIRYQAFEGCSSLNSINIPDGVTAIEDRVFYGCSSLTSIVIPDGVARIGASAFADCSSLTSVIIPNGVASIGGYAFNGCSSLASVVIPDSVTAIGNYSFEGCSSLASIVIPDSVKSLGRHVFYGCSSLDSIVIPEGVTDIGSAAFMGCSSLTSIVIPEGVKAIGEYMFDGCSSLSSIVIPEGVTNIGRSAFSGCSNLTSIVIPDGVTVIDEYVFSYCSSLTSIVIPDGVSSIRSHAFDGCSSLTSIVIPEGVTSINDYVFSNCSSLTSIVIPCGVTFISSRAFYGCSGLGFVYCKPQTPPRVGYQAFYKNNSEQIIYVPAESLAEYQASSDWSEYSGSIQGYDF